MGLTIHLHLLCGRTWSKDQLFSISQEHTYSKVDINEILLNAIFSLADELCAKHQFQMFWYWYSEILQLIF